MKISTIVYLIFSIGGSFALHLSIKSYWVAVLLSLLWCYIVMALCEKFMN